MPEFDPRSLIFVSSLLGLVCSAILFMLRRSFPATIGGLDEWAWGVLATVIASILFSLRGVIPESFSVIVANGLLVGGFMLVYAGLLDFSGRSTNVRMLVPALILITGLCAWFTLFQPSYNTRVLLISATNTILLSTCGLLAFKASGNSLAGGFTGAALLLAALVSAARFVATLMHFDGATHLLDLTSLQRIYLASFSFTVLIVTVGLMMMANERLRSTLEYIAGHDALSGAYSRGTFLGLLTKEVARSQRHRRPVALLIMDLDNFKSVNDRFGHLTGDQVIVDFVSKTQALLRQHDFLGRYGGEEFVALLPETTLEDAYAVAERICIGIAAASSATLPAYTVSIGVAAARDGNMLADTLLSVADQALYLAKQNGRNRVEQVQQDISRDTARGDTSQEPVLDIRNETQNQI